MDLDRLEQSVYKSTWDDGLLDLFVGIGLAMVGFSWMMHSYIGGILVVLVVPLWRATRDRIVVPRRGLIKPNPERQSREKRTHLGLVLGSVVMFLAGLAAFFAMESGAAGELFMRVIPVVPAIGIAIASIGAGLAVGLGRFVAYGVVLLIAAGVSVALIAGPGWALFAGGVVMIVSGAALLTRFIKRYPLSEARA